MTPEAWGFLGVVATGIFGIITLVVQQRRKGNLDASNPPATPVKTPTPTREESSMRHADDPLEKAVSLALDRVTTLLEETTDHLNEIQKELRTTQQELIEKRGEVQTLREKHSQAQNKISELQHELTTMHDQLNACRREIETLRRKMGGSSYGFD